MSRGEMGTFEVSNQINLDRVPLSRCSTMEVSHLIGALINQCNLASTQPYRPLINSYQAYQKNELINEKELLYHDQQNCNHSTRAWF